MFTVCRRHDHVQRFTVPMLRCPSLAQRFLLGLVLDIDDPHFKPVHRTHQLQQAATVLKWDGCWPPRYYQVEPVYFPFAPKNQHRLVDHSQWQSVDVCLVRLRVVVDHLRWHWEGIPVSQFSCRTAVVLATHERCVVVQPRYDSARTSLRHSHSDEQVWRYLPASQSLAGVELVALGDT